MFTYLARRFLIMVPTLLIISALVFIIIKLPPGDFLTNQIAELQSQGDKAAIEKVAFLRKQYGLDKPFLEQYAVWVGLWKTERGFSGLLQGDWGWSFEYDMPVSKVIGDRMLLSFILNVTVILFTWTVAFPIGVYAATHQYSWGDHGLTLLGYVGLATPNFLFALVLMYFANVEFGLAIGGIPAVVIAAYLVKSLPLDWLRWLVVVVVIYAAAGLLRSALAAKTAQDMGLKPVAHIEGGFAAWREAGGPVEAYVPKTK